MRRSTSPEENLEVGTNRHLLGHRDAGATRVADRVPSAPTAGRGDKEPYDLTEDLSAVSGLPTAQEHANVDTDVLVARRLRKDVGILQHPPHACAVANSGGKGGLFKALLKSTTRRFW